jgi:predicted DNA binding CopG/RHH family protein
MKDKIIKVRVSAEQFDIIERAAFARSIPRSTMIRWLVMQDAVAYLKDRGVEVGEING